MTKNIISLNESPIVEIKKKCISSDISFSEISFSDIQSVRDLISEKIASVSEKNDVEKLHYINSLMNIDDILLSITNDTDAIIIK